MVVEAIAITLLVGAFFCGVVSLLWGARRLSRDPAWAGAEQQCRKTSTILLAGCLFTSTFFPPILLLTKAPLPLIISFQEGSGLMLLVWGEARLRAAVVSQRPNRPGTLWMVFLGALFLLVYLPAWLHLPGWSAFFYAAICCVLCPLGQYRLIQYWKRISQKRQPDHQEE